MLTADVPEPLTAWADPEKLNRVLTNLVGNGIKYSPRGGEVKVSARHDPDNARLIFSVADHGIGIPEVHREAIFTLFYRVKHPDAAQPRGSGLGLYIVRELLTMMHGEIWLESELGKGSTFYFSLPDRDVSTHRLLPHQSPPSGETNGG